MLLRFWIAFATFASVAAQGQSCKNARAASSAQLGEEGQTADAIYQKPACQRIRMPDLKNVFIARVTRIKNHDGELNLDGKCVKTLLQTVYMRVREQLIGDAGADPAVSAGDLNGYYFKTGRAYLVYAELLKDGTFHVSGYGQTKLISEASADLAFIRSYGRRRPGSEIFGRAWKAANATVASQMVGWPVKPMKDLKVTIQGDAHHEAIVGADGKYKVADLPPGKYVVSIDEESAVWPSSSQIVEVTNKGCAEVNFSVDPFHTRDGALIKPQP